MKYIAELRRGGVFFFSFLFFFLWAGECNPNRTQNFRNIIYYRKKIIWKLLKE